MFESVHWLDLTLIVVYLAALIAVGHFMSKGIKSGEDFFLAGRSLPWWIIGFSIIGTNIGSNDYVGASGGAYKIGIAQANFEWIGAIPAMILASFLFIPFYWKAGVYSIPEYLGMRYNQAVRFITAIVLTIFSIMIVGVFLWATSIMLQTYLGLPIWLGILVTGTVVGFYTISGGLKAVAFTDAIQLFIMLFGAIALAYLGIEQAGGWNSFIHKIETNHPEHLQAFLPDDHPEFPWPGVILGLSLVLSPAYWCANQAILQRTLAARSQWDSQASMITAAIAKSFVPFLIVLPGFLALVLSAEKLDPADQALPWVIKNVLPPGLSGLLFVAFIAALQSSVDSTLNSAATMVTRDIYKVGAKAMGRPADGDELKIGKWVTFTGLILGMLLAPVTGAFSGIYAFVQQMLSFFQGPVFALLLAGILSRIPSPSGGLYSLIIGLLSAMFTSLILDLNMLYVAFISFCVSLFVLFLISPFTKPTDDSVLAKITIRRIKDAG